MRKPPLVALLIPALAARLRQGAPGLTLSVLPLGRAAALEALAEGRADIALGFVWDVPEVISHETLYTEGFLVAGLPRTLPDAPDLGIDAYCAADHILVSPAGDLRGVVDDRLEAMGRSRRIVLGLASFLPALAAAAAAGALVTLPARIATGFAPGFGLVVATPPVAVRSFPVSVFWHRRNDTDPRIAWLRRQVAPA